MTISVLLKRGCFIPAILCIASLAGGCKKSETASTEGFPEGFQKVTDAGKVDFVMKHASPDSVARFVIDATLGRLGNIRIDSLPLAATHAYSHYNDSALIAYSVAFDEYAASLPLPDKMQIYVAAGKSVPQQLGYQLGLEYVSQIREKHKTVERVKEEIEIFKSACADDTLTYTRFLKGFRTALQVDHGQDLPEEIFKAFAQD